MSSLQFHLDGRSSTEVLIAAMDELGQSEATGIIVLFTNEAQEVVCKTNCRRVLALGLLSYAHDMALHPELHQDDDAAE